MRCRTYAWFRKDWEGPRQANSLLAELTTENNWLKRQ